MRIGFFLLSCFVIFSTGFDVIDNYLYDVVWPGANQPQTPDDDGLPGYFVMKTEHNETYSCHLPSVIQEKGFQSSDKEPQTALSLLAPFFESAPCIFKVDGYWTYEVCHGKHIRQFRAEVIGPHATRIVKEFFLGKYSESANQQLQESADASEPGSIRINGRDLPFYSVEYDLGTVCDLTGGSRRASVLYVCVEESDGELFQISELETCVYQLVVFTRHLCSSSRFNSHKVYLNAISCYPMDELTQTKPASLVSLEKEKAELLSLEGHATLEGIFGAIRAKGLKVEKFDQHGSVVYQVRSIDPISEDKVSEDSDTASIEEEVEESPSNDEEDNYGDDNDDDHNEAGDGDEMASVDVKGSPSPEGQQTVVEVRRQEQEVHQQKLKSLLREETRLAQLREIRSFLASEACLSGGVGWWKHEVCFGGKVMQYHENPETQERIEIVLGRWDQSEHLEWVRRSSLRRPYLPVDKRVKLTQFYGNGDFCEEVGQPRNVRLSLVCQPKAINSVQLAFSEPTTCQYSIRLESVHFCGVVKQANDDGLLPVEVEL